MKFQNLLGMFSVLLIALSGPSYASGYVSPPASPPSAIPTTPLPSTIPSTIPFTPSTIPFTPSPADTIAPTVLGPEGTESNCGGSVESCKKEGEDRGSSLAKRVIKKIVEKEILDAKDKGKTIADLPKILEYYEKDGSGELLFQILLTLVHPVGGGVGLTKPEKVLTKLAAQRAEFSLRTIIKRLLKSARNPNCDDNCKAYNESKIKAVDTFHESFVEALYHADIPLLQPRIPG
jgi:hypothetical protein